MPYNYEAVEGYDRAGAKAALDQAEANGFPRSSVISTETGWLVPTEEVEAEEPLGAVEATIDAWGEERQEEEGSANIEVQESQVPDSTPFDVDSAKVPELDDYIERHNLDVDKSLNKPDKVAAIKAAQENKE